jgi:cholesterol oxidase
MNDRLRLSRPIEALIEEEDTPPERDGQARPIAAVDVVIVGSGYGGSIAAACLAGEGRRVVILERGREYGLGDFPVGLGEVPRHVRFRRAGDEEAIGYADALFDVRVGDDMDVLVGSGLGGTSLINANVAARPDDDELGHLAWPRALREDRARFSECVRAVERLLGVTDAVPPTRKYAALSTLAEALRPPDTTAPRPSTAASVLEVTRAPAPVTVTFRPGAAGDPGRPGIPQAPCTMCGNCVTGCNVGAKNTLMMNALPLAASRGAEIFTGVTVLSVRRVEGDSAHPWRVRLRTTTSEKSPLRDEVFHLAARDVVLAAGTLGSTEILMRSRDAHGLAVSAVLGTRFSGNGDALAFGYAQASPVGAMATPTQDPSEPAIGPTITGIVRMVVREASGQPRTLTLEDGTVPASLKQVFGEGITTGAFFQRLGKPALPAWHASRQAGASPADPLTVSDGALDHSQVLLVMGDDGSAGTLRLRVPSDGRRATALDRAHLVVDWPSVARNPSLRLSDAVLEPQDRGPGFDGGQYVPNPLWRLLPREASSVMSGPPPGGRAITVHPLGGCPMGDSAASGVVNHAGQVFDAGGDGTAVHDGLHVLDGSIVPKALGINPFLTISALAWRAAQLLRDARGWSASPKETVDAAVRSTKTLQPRERTAPAVVAPDKVGIVLKERLTGTVKPLPRWLRNVSPIGRRASLGAWEEKGGLILRLSMHVPDLAGRLQDFTEQPVDVDAAVYARPPDRSDQAGETVSSGRQRRRRRARLGYKRDAAEETDDDLVARGRGTVFLLKPDRVNGLRRAWRAILALGAYHSRRQTLWRFLREHGADLLGGRPRRPSILDGHDPKVGPLEQIRGFWKVAWQHAIYRRMQYRIEFRAGHDGAGPVLFTLEGKKLLAWCARKPRLWDSLLNMPFTLQGPSRMRASAHGRLAVDIDYLAGEGIPQVQASPHLPAALAGFAGLGLLFARALLQTHFWDFGAPTYPDRPLPRPAGPLPLRVGDQVLAPETIEFVVPLCAPASDPDAAPDERTARLRLTRYRRPDGEPVLLIHGLAQGSLIYSTDTLDTNMAAAMWAAGYDVWLVDYRLSNMLPEPVAPSGWTMDDIARHDIPAAIQHVFRASGERPVRVFAHCVGATTVAMAILRGWVEPGQIRCLALNAIHPWTMFSVANKFKARLGAFFRDVLQRDLLDPIPAPRPPAPQAMLDRLAFSLARAEDAEDDRRSGRTGRRREAKSHRRYTATEIAETVCDRMTFLYARMWRHSNLDPRTHAAFPTLVGPAPGEVYRQLYFFAQRERLTTHDGVSAYLTERNLCDRWRMPTAFFHGEESGVFNPESATRSALNLDAIVNDRGGRQVPIRVCRILGYGHMDVIFGKDAHTDVFTRLTDFFDCPEAPVELLEGVGDDRPGITAGPVLRAAWTEDGLVYARLWAETDEDVPTVSDNPVFKNQRFRGEPWRIGSPGYDPQDDSAEQRYHLLDVELPAAGAVAFGPPPSRAPGSPGTETGKGDEPTDGRFAWDAALPWLARLREAAKGRPCRDMRFLVGSCRYPGTPFESEASDLVFGGMRAHIAGTHHAGAQMLFLIGDQIYADATASILDAATWRERYSQRYREAFVSHHAREVLRLVPTHFAIDDHEILDNWAGHDQQAPDTPGERHKREEVAHAIRAARFFQSSGRDTHPVAARAGSALWYPLDDATEHCCPAFVMDTRSERILRRFEPGRSARLVSLEQLGALQAWLLETKRRCPDRPKFVFCAVGIAPISRDQEAFPETWRSSDSWLGYPGALAEVLTTIVENEIEHVVFVSGDLHLSSVSRLRLTANGAEAVVAWQLVSSGLYAPMPFANADVADYVWNDRVRVTVGDGTRRPVDVEAQSGLLRTGEPHFMRVDAEETADGWKLAVAVAGSDGNLLAPLGAPPTDVTADGCAWIIGLRRPSPSLPQPQLLHG